VPAAPLHVFAPRPAIRREQPALVDFWLAEASTVKMEILDAAGSLVRTIIPDRPGKPGLTRASWDLRYPGAVVFEGLVVRGPDPTRGPWAPPGRYQVRVTAGGRTEVQPLVVEKDPRLTTVTQPDLEEQFRLAMKARDATSAANQAVIRIRAARKEIEARTPAGGRPSRQDAERLGKLSAIEEALYQVKNQSIKDVLAFPIRLNNRLAAVQRVVEEGDGRPTKQSYDVLAELTGELERHLTALAHLLGPGAFPGEATR
jgi:hypothetical protein